MTDRSSDFHAALRHRRSTLGLKTPEDEILPRTHERLPFTAEALATLQKIITMSKFLRDNHSAYMLDDDLHGMTDAERDEVDAESQRFLKSCSERVDVLRQMVHSSQGNTRGFLSSPSTAVSQAAGHQHAVIQLLFERLQQVAVVFDGHRGHRLRCGAGSRFKSHSSSCTGSCAAAS